MLSHTVEELENWSGEKPVLAVIGDPVDHSLSPQLHEPALRSRGISGSYIRVHVRSGEVDRAFRAMERLSMTGCNVTIPHKKEALENVTDVTEEARLIDSVNTVLFRDGSRFGSNSDAPGIARALEERTGRALGTFRAMILGAGGGAGRAAAVRCALDGCQEVWLFNRTRSKARDLLQRLPSVSGSIACPEWSDASVAEALERCDLVINGTSLGMKNPLESPIDPTLLTTRHTLFEMIYRPGGTRLAQAAAVCVDGLDMLLHQGVVSFRTWFGDPVPVEEMRAGLGLKAPRIA